MLRIWISSFIPKDIPGRTMPVPDGSGRTMMPGPTPLNDCFLTDQRGFAAEPTAASRMRSLVEIDEAGLTLVAQRHHCDNTVEVDCEDGDVECDLPPDPSGLTVVDFQSTGAGCSFRFKGAANNPCFSGSPYIEWIVSVAVTRSGGRFTVAAQPGSVVEPFPAFEMYATTGGPAKALFQVPPNAGAGPGDLYGPPNKPVSGSVTVP